MARRKLWIKSVKTRSKAPAGLFAKGSAKAIATWAKRGVSRGRAIKRIVFYINRAGSNLSASRRAVLKKALSIVRGKSNKRLKRKN